MGDFFFFCKKKKKSAKQKKKKQEGIPYYLYSIYIYTNKLKQKGRKSILQVSHGAKVLRTTTSRVVLSFLIRVFRARLASLTFPLSKLIILRTQMPFLHI